MLSVMQFETGPECKQMAQRFLLYVINIFDALGFELNECIVFPKGKTLKIDRAYLGHWIDFESKGYPVI